MVKMKVIKSIFVIKYLKINFTCYIYQEKDSSQRNNVFVTSPFQSTSQFLNDNFFWKTLCRVLWSWVYILQMKETNQTQKC